MKVVSLVGARPQFIKAFPISRALADRHEEVLVHTGQHYSEAMSEVFFEELAIPTPEYNLGVGSGTHGQQTGEMVTRFGELIEREEPDAVVVYGDTNSTLAGAVVTAKTDAPLAHVEAGLRSHNDAMPEETNRILTDHVSDLLFAPTERGVTNLETEGIENVHLTGDVMYDAILWARTRAADHSTVLDEHDLTAGEYVLATVHRAGNTDDRERLAAIMRALGAADREVVFPIHPRTADRLDTYGLRETVEQQLTVIEPQGYLDFVRLLDGAERVATDSGGVQKEAFFLDAPCVTLREETEWVETVDAGWNTLVGADEEAIERELQREITLPEKPELYGDGNAAERMVALLEEADG
ncbi:non-hydrolyzing UDP-N-acetylglucosamine 2-epimerase [Halococcus qingdaonensis]|uniref:non-hydrolyzing UDP-N-acetylglucosamine 2-epimerase n=1 Tax=Halococcus qingdaonensis TaxID=224402 RepID=UPI002116E568|nr:UDP-N-acetylglucosamine 2-epimerase (non-hydrolyzing) [Halococcus qingdaonensis]